MNTATARTDTATLRRASHVGGSMNPEEDIRLNERVMRRLLEAAEDGMARRLSRLEQVAIAEASRVRPSTGSRPSDIYRNAARHLREVCIQYGAPRSRYLAGEWIRLGL
jgi:hypothetical protein